MRALGLGERRGLLGVLFSDFEQDRVRLSQTFDADGPSVLQSACKMGLEGIIAKRLNALYRSGARTDMYVEQAGAICGRPHAEVIPQQRRA